MRDTYGEMPALYDGEIRFLVKWLKWFKITMEWGGNRPRHSFFLIANFFTNWDTKLELIQNIYACICSDAKAYKTYLFFSDS